MKIARPHHIVAAFLSMLVISAPLSLAQNEGNSPARPKDSSEKDRYPLPKEGLVPDKETAIKIAEAVLFRLYGEDTSNDQRPDVVKEADYIWWISGTLPKDNFGSVFNIGISKHTAAILRLTVGEDKLAGSK